MSDGTPEPENLPLIVPDVTPVDAEAFTPIEVPDEDKALVLSVKATKALNYLCDRLRPWFPGEGGEDLLRYILTPLLKATHSKTTRWQEKIVASAKLAEMVGLYMAGESANRVKGFKALPRRNTGT